MLETAVWYRKAAEQENAIAKRNLGILHINGNGVNQDYAEAMHWLRKAAEQGEVDALLNLGVLYATGQGVDQDFNLALEWLSEAAGQKHHFLESIWVPRTSVVKLSRKIILTRRVGIAPPPILELFPRNSIWDLSIPLVRVLGRIILKQSTGITKTPNRGWPWPKSIWQCSITMASVYCVIPPKRGRGIHWPLTWGMQMRFRSEIRSTRSYQVNNPNRRWHWCGN